ncbi:glycosyltransferase family 4 protein [Candidatus Saccharibacteria bacterium]|nr:glycosyltransferase family 4 protein [Candidatus Saccharibacteria bacterium]
MKKKIVFVAPQTKSLINFRGDLMKDIVKKGYAVVAVIPEDESREFFIKNHIKTRLLVMDKNSTSIFQNISYYKKLKQIIKEEKPDKVFCYTIKPVIFGSIAAHKAGIKEIYSLICGLGYVYSANGTKHKLLQKICDKAYKHALKYNKKVIFQNQDDIDEFVKRKNLSKAKCELVNGSGVNLNKFKRNDLPKGISFLMVSRILKGKGVMEYFEAARIVKEKYPQVHFTYIGQIDHGQSAIKYDGIKPYIDDGIVEYVSYTTHAEKYFEKCSVFVLPSYYREGIPRTLIEATAMGRPIITTKTPGCKETVVDGKNGYFVKPRSAKNLAEKMILMIKNSDQLQKMGDTSYSLCLEKFDIKIINDQMLKIMEV